MVGWLEQLGPRLGDASLACLVLTGLAALAMIACRQPVRRLTIARGALVASLAVWPLVVWSPAPRVDVVAPLLEVAPPIWNRLAPAPLCHDRAGSRDAWTPSAAWRARASAAYLGGAALGLGWLTLGWWGSSRLARRSVAASAGSQAILDALAAADGGPRPRLRVAPGLNRPALIGVFRPTILLPTAWDDPARRDALRLCLLHERVHARRRDPGFALVAGLAQAAWFYLPTLWLVRAQMRLDQEFLADHAAATGFGPFGSYAASLVDLADSGGVGGVERASGGGSALWPRILMLVRCPFPFEARSNGRWRLGAASVLAAVTLLATGLSIRPPEATVASTTSPALPKPAGGRLHIALLSLERGSLPFRLPVAPPDRFDLSMEIWAEPSTLDGLRVAGGRLAAEGIPTGPDGWRAIKVRRGSEGLEVRVDGIPIPQHRPGPTVPALEIASTPPTPLFIRELVLSW